ncbi:MAG: SRPBCC family protein [Myxococcota bacterium]
MTALVVVLGGLGVLALFLVVLSGLSPVRVEYTEYIDVDAPVGDVFDDIRLQDHLMRWSAWPPETNSQCAVDPGPTGVDGTKGARTVFLSRGREVGHQTITSIIDQREVVMTLVGPGPPHHPELRFEVEPLDEKRCRVHLHFLNRLPRPFNAIWHFGGLSAWTREMHRRDLAGLKAFSEPPHLDADGRVVGRPPTAPNPYAVPLPAAS